MSSGHHGTWCRGRRAVTSCLSSRCYYDFSISVNFAKCLKFRDYRSCSLTGVRVVYLPDYCYSLVCLQNNPDEPPKHGCGMRRALVRPGVIMRVVAKVSGPLVQGFCLVAPPPAARSRPAVRYILDFPQSSPSLFAARSTASPSPEYSTTVSQVHRGGSNALSSLFSSCPNAGGLSSISPGLSRPSVYLTDTP